MHVLIGVPTGRRRDIECRVQQRELLLMGVLARVPGSRTDTRKREPAVNIAPPLAECLERGEREHLAPQRLLHVYCNAPFGPPGVSRETAKPR